MLHEARGITDAVRGLVRGLAAEGWLTVAPHLYHRDAADELGEDDGDRIREQVGRLDGDQVMADTDTAFGWLAEHEVSADRMGVLGLRHRRRPSRCWWPPSGPSAPRCRWRTRPPSSSLVDRLPSSATRWPA